MLEIHAPATKWRVCACLGIYPDQLDAVAFAFDLVLSTRVAGQTDAIAFDTPPTASPAGGKGPSNLLACSSHRV